jgi:ribosomal-protein-alanine N-acetyltransferase
MSENKPEFPTPPGLVGKTVYLRPATAEDVANTFHWHLLCDPSMLSCRPHPFSTAADAAERYRKREPSADEQLFVIVALKEKTTVGVIRYFNWNNLNRSAELGLLVDPDQHRKGYGIEAVRLLTRYLFQMRDLNRVYACTSSLNKATVGLLEKAGFKRDGTLRHQYFHNGELHDGYIYSLLRFEFGR